MCIHASWMNLQISEDCPWTPCGTLAGNSAVGLQRPPAFTSASPPFFLMRLRCLQVILRSQPLALWDFIKYSNSIALNINPVTHSLTVIHPLQSLGATECFHYRALVFLLSSTLSTNLRPLNEDLIGSLGQVCDKGVQCPGLMVRLYLRMHAFKDAFPVPSIPLKAFEPIFLIVSK